MAVDPAFRQLAVTARESLNASPQRDRLRRDACVWSGVVYLQPHDFQIDDLRRELTRMRSLGFQVVRFHDVVPLYRGAGEWDLSRAHAWLGVATEVGLGVVMCAEVFGRPPALLLKEHGLTAEDFQRRGLQCPVCQDVVRAYMQGFIGGLRKYDCIVAWAVLSEPHPADDRLTHPEDRAAFLAWLQAQYGSLNALASAWRYYPGQPFAETWDQAVEWAVPPSSSSITGVHLAQQNYGARRDLRRFIADRTVSHARVQTRIAAEIEPNRPIAVGSHQLFINQPRLGWDIGEWARSGHLHTTSIHLSWHFEAVEGEVDLPVYLQSRQTRDYFKGGFTSAFETTGGPVQFSGGYGNHMDAGLMRRLCLAYLAAGNQSMAFWTWNSRAGGWEQGEYGMTGLSGKPMPWAHEAGRVARAMETWRHEIWDEQPLHEAGVVESWDTDAILLMEPSRYDLQPDVPGVFHAGSSTLHRRSLVGAGRAMTRQQVDFEYVTQAELKRGLAGCYDCLVLPFHRAVSREFLDVLVDYVRAGGRIVADAQFAFCDEHGRVHRRGENTPLATLFGGWAEAIHDSRTGAPRFHQNALTGFWAELEPAAAEVIETFEDGRPAVLRHRLGKGEALLCALDLGWLCWKPGRDWAEALYARLVRPGSRAWHSSLPQTVRRRTAHADHYFLHNPGSACTATVEVSDQRYTEAIDVLAGTRMIVDASRFQVPINAGSAAWIRCHRG